MTAIAFDTPELRAVDDLHVPLRHGDSTTKRLLEDVQSLVEAASAQPAGPKEQWEIELKAGPGAGVRSALRSIRNEWAHGAGAFNLFAALDSASDYPRDISVLVALVEASRGIDVQLERVSVPNSTVTAILRGAGSGRAVITVNSEASQSWQRLGIAKELAHLLLDSPASPKPDLPHLLEELALQSAGSWRRENSPLSRYALDEMLALELLFPVAARGPLAELVKEGRLRHDELAVLFDIPPSVVASALSLPPAETARYSTLLRAYVASGQPKTAGDVEIEESDVDLELAKNLLERSGGGLTLDEASTLTGLDASALKEAIAGGILFGLPVGSRWLLPKKQFLRGTGQVAPGLSEVLLAFRDRHPLAVLQFLATPDTALNGLAPLEALHDVDMRDAVLRVARAHQGDVFA